jgi:hypothetical protein
MPLLDLIHHAQTLTFTPPPNKLHITDYTEEETFEAAMSQMLKDPTIVYGLIMSCKKYSIIKMLIKQVLHRYIRKYGNTSPNKC